MKKVLLVISIGIIAAFIVFSFRMEDSQSVSPVSQQTLSEQSEVTQDSTHPGIPTRLIINKIGVNASVESVGMDAQQRMDVPKNDFNVAWYNLGFKPGEQGSAVIAGHFDTRTGAPSVFYKLSELISGDIVTVELADGTELSYKVTRGATYPFDQVPLNEVFNSQDKPRLNLITCEGVFNKSSKNYSQRFVIYTELVQ